MIIDNLTVQLNNKSIIRSLSCVFIPSRITLLLGTSGAGKTTLLKTMAGLIPASQGDMRIEHKSIAKLTEKERAEKIGYVFQDFNLFSNLTVEQNCIDPLLVHGLSYEQAYARVQSMLQEFDMGAFTKRYPAELSGGQQQRVAIARALCLQPSILLLDEPTASLDPFNSAVLLSILKRLAAQGITIVASCQDIAFAQTIFDRAYYMQAGTIIEYCDTKNSLAASPLISAFLT